MTERLQGRYRITELLGSGAFATVHKAHDEQLDDWVAIKILAHNHSVNPEMRGRFIAEGQILRRLQSPHILQVHDLAETDDGRPYLVTQLADRGTLRARVQQARADGWTVDDQSLLPVAQALAFGIDTLAAAQVVHRDLSPSNLLLTTAPADPNGSSDQLVGADERLIIADLGFCKDLALSSGISATGGTDGFAPPEQHTLGAAVDVRSDLWAASAVLHWIATGHTPKRAPIAERAMITAGLTPAFAHAVAEGLHDHPAERPTSADAWIGAITSAARPAGAGTTTTGTDDRTAAVRTRPHLMIAAVAAILLLGLATQVLGNDELPPASVTIPGTAAEAAQNEAPPVPIDEDVENDTQPTGSTPTIQPSAAPTGEESTEQEPTAPPLPIDVGTPVGGTWSFHIVNRNDWEYDVEVTISAAYGFDKTTSDSGPGDARTVTAVDGGYEFTAIPTITDRDSPEVDQASATARFGNDILTGALGADPCPSEIWNQTGGTDYGIYCLLDEGHDSQSSGESWTTRPETDIDNMLATMQDRDPIAYSFDISTCEIWLLPNGDVMPATRGNNCDITGRTVIPEGTPGGLDR
ncbi:serine/threonine protein kinase [Euzebya tangerina]|uniref:serine/threonine protein kinase n=1 Tax=Euzebya tangerina TaxID=591198 RepID=UPI000E315F3D|nr:serine/threonine-protein kinase [Euzebya tangerina]